MPISKPTPTGFPGPGPRVPQPTQAARVQPLAGSALAKTNHGGGILQRIGASFTQAFRS